MLADQFEACAVCCDEARAVGPRGECDRRGGAPFLLEPKSILIISKTSLHSVQKRTEFLVFMAKTKEGTGVC
jgi:hypothetical protein